MSKNNFSKWSVGLFILGLLMISASAVLYFIGYFCLKNKIVNLLVLKNDSDSTRSWANPTAKVYRKYFFFEVLNPNELSTGQSDIPWLKERGPYVYEEKMTKKNIIFSNDGKNVTYTPVFTLFFRSDLSVGNDSDSFTFLNIPLIAISDRISNGDIKLSEIKLGLLNYLISLKNVELFEKRSVHDLVNGYTDFIVDEINKNKPGVLKNGMFSILNGKNGSEYQNFTILTGAESLSDLGTILRWNGKKSLDWWYTPGANMINGTDGFLYRPFRNKSEILQVFNSDMCKSFDLVYLSKSSLNGIETLDFHMRNDIFANFTNNPLNKGFCNEMSSESSCSTNGLFNTSNCNTMPIILSQPHFLNADKSLIESIKGISPDSSLHDSILHFQPLIGSPVFGSFRLQFNFKIRKSTELNIFKSVSEVLLPIAWFDKSFSLDENAHDKLSKLGLLSTLIIAIPSQFAVFGVIFLSISLILYVIMYVKSRRTEFDHQKLIN